MCERLGDKFAAVTGESTRLGAEVTRRQFQQQRQRRRRKRPRHDDGGGRGMRRGGGRQALARAHA